MKNRRHCHFKTTTIHIESNVMRKKIYLSNTNRSNKHNKYVVSQTLEYLDDVSLRELALRIRVFSCYKIICVPSSNKILVSSFTILFYEAK